jgi:hypothetical protein
MKLVLTCWLACLPLLGGCRAGLPELPADAPLRWDGRAWIPCSAPASRPAVDAEQFAAPAPGWPPDKLHAYRD